MSNNSYGFKYPVKYAFGSTVYSIAQVNRWSSQLFMILSFYIWILKKKTVIISTFLYRNYADPLLSFSSSVGEKDYSDRLLYKVGKHVCIFDPETGKQQFFDGSRQPIVGRLICYIKHSNKELL